MTLQTVRCIWCQKENSFGHEKLRNLQSVKCDNCSKEFNLFGIWNSLYQTNPLCERLVDVATTHTDSDFDLDSGNRNELNRISNVLQKNDFSKLKRQILKDLILYGNSFILMESSGSTLKLRRFEPKDLSFKVDWVQEPPFQASQEKVVSIIEVSNPSINYSQNNVLHYKIRDMGYEPFGFSILGMWFHDWYFLGDWEKTVPLLNRRTTQEKVLKEFWEFRESAVIRAANIPQELIFPWIRTKSTQLEWDMFSHAIDERRNELREVTEQKMFPRILNRPFDRTDFPRLNFIVDS